MCSTPQAYSRRVELFGASSRSGATTPKRNGCLVHAGRGWASSQNAGCVNRAVAAAMEESRAPRRREELAVAHEDLAATDDDPRAAGDGTSFVEGVVGVAALVLRGDRQRPL